MNDLTQVLALEAYAAMMNTLDASRIEPILADDFHYSSQWVLTDITSKQEFLDYITPKLIAIRDSGSVVTQIVHVEVFSSDGFSQFIPGFSVIRHGPFGCLAFKQ